MTMMLGEVLGAGIASAATSAKKLVHIALLALYQIKLPKVKVNAGHDAVEIGQIYTGRVSQISSGSHLLNK